MTLSPLDRQAIVDYRVEKSRAPLREAEYVMAGKFWSLTANRLYYATFYACEALLIKNGIEASTHSGVSHMMNLHFVKTEILTHEDKTLLSALFRMRQTGDYDDLTDWTQEDIEPLYPKAKELIDKLLSIIDQSQAEALR